MRTLCEARAHGGAFPPSQEIGYRPANRSTAFDDMITYKVPATKISALPGACRAGRFSGVVYHAPTNAHGDPCGGRLRLGAVSVEPVRRRRLLCRVRAMLGVAG